MFYKSFHQIIALPNRGGPVNHPNKLTTQIRKLVPSHLQIDHKQKLPLMAEAFHLSLPNPTAVQQYRKMSHLSLYGKCYLSLWLHESLKAKELKLVLQSTGRHGKPIIWLDTLRNWLLILHKQTQGSCLDLTEFEQ